MKILCLGMNYATHNNSAKEALLKTEEPIVFLKADSCLLKGGKPFFVPDDLGRIDFEDVYKTVTEDIPALKEALLRPH